ncbi:MAG TPA: hypothetical protein VNT79_05530 [Phycisphaerae bacterium]|nr:hypothetical protein [Phycisphaerae bacterium]
MFEHRFHPLIPFERFILRLLRMGVIAAAIVLGALGIGVLGYHHIDGFGWIDSLYNAAMILTGMGPPMPVKTDAGKLFATAYALFAGVIFLSVAAVLFAPVAHRMIHHFHLDLMDDGDDQKEAAGKPVEGG